MHVEERKGYVKIYFYSDDTLNAFYESSDRVEYLSDELYSKSLFMKKDFKHFDEYVKENEYVMIYFKNELVAIYCYQNKVLRHIKAKPISNDYFGKISPRNPEQQCAFDMLQNKDTLIKIITGRFGSGKSYLMICHALDKVFKNEVDKIIYVRNNIELKDTVPLGALPGTLDDKMIAWAANVADHVGGPSGLKMLMDNGQFEIAPLGYLRGRDFKNAIIFCDEAENLTTSQVQLLIGRIGEGSQLWLAGDRKQVDKKVFEKDSGMGRAIEKLRGKPLFGYINLEKSERSEASAYADYLD